MHRVQGSTTVNGHFQTGTVLPADWCNSVQDEVCNFIEANGIQVNTPEQDNDPAKGNRQLKAAVDKSVADGVASALTNYATKDDLAKAIAGAGGATKDDIAALQKDIAARTEWAQAWFRFVSGDNTITYPNLPK